MSRAPHPFSWAVWRRFFVYSAIVGFLVLIAVAGGDADLGPGETKASWRTLGLCGVASLSVLSILVGIFAPEGSLAGWQSSVVLAGAITLVTVTPFCIRSIVGDLTPAGSPRA